MTPKIIGKNGCSACEAQLKPPVCGQAPRRREVCGGRGASAAGPGSPGDGCAVSAGFGGGLRALSGAGGCGRRDKSGWARVFRGGDARCPLRAQGWRGSGVPGTSRLGLLAFQSPRAWSLRLQPSDGVGGALGTPRRHPSECGFKVEKKRAPGRKRPSPHFLRFPLWPGKEAALSPLAWGGGWGTVPVEAGSTRVPAECPYSMPHGVFLMSQDSLGGQGR